MGKGILSKAGSGSEVQLQTVDLVIKNGVIVTPAGRYEAGIAVNEGKIVLIGKEAQLPNADTTIDLKRRFILPGMIDAHVHFRDPGKAEAGKEDFVSGTAAAASGGLTTVLDMPNTVPHVMSTSILEDKLKIIQGKAHVDFGLYGGAGVQNLKELDALGRAGVVGFKTFMTPGRAYSATDDLSLFRIFEKLAEVGLPCSLHAENGEIIQYLIEKLQAAGRKDAMAHPESRPNFAEAQAISKALILADATKVKLHIAHMSTAEGTQLVKSAKAMGQKISVETCPQYLILTDDMMKQKGAYAKINPPLRSTRDTLALWEGLRNGTIDIVASDHAPYTKADKEPGFEDIWKATSGSPSVETMIPLLLNKVNEGAISLERLVEVTSEKVSKIFGIYPKKGTIRVGSDADFTVVDLNVEKTIKAENLRSQARDTIVYDGWRIKGMPTGTIVRGKVIMWEGEILGKPGDGKFITPHDL